MISNGVFGMNAATIILASGFSGPTDLGEVPASALALAKLPQQVRLLRAGDSVTFKLPATNHDRIRSDTANYRWLTQIAPGVVTAPDYFSTADRPERFQLIKRSSTLAKYPEIKWVRFIIKFVPKSDAGPPCPELRLQTVVLHSQGSIHHYLTKATQIGV